MFKTWRQIAKGLIQNECTSLKYENMKLSQELVSVHIFQLIGLEEKTNRDLFSEEFVNKYVLFSLKM